MKEPEFEDYRYIIRFLGHVSSVGDVDESVYTLLLNRTTQCCLPVHPLAFVLPQGSLTPPEEGAKLL